MVELHGRMNGTVNVYTMDHRGTGRSTLLDCVAAQATTTGSPVGSSIDTSEVPACAEALEKKFGSLSSFSMTSAAMDMATFISNYSNDANTIVYAVSYGTALIERLIHLAPPEVTGYVLDGVATSSGAAADKFEYFSTWDADFGDVGDAFMALCPTIGECDDRFSSSDLATTLQNLLTQFDSDPDSTCAALVSTVNSDVNTDPVSYIVREALGSLLQSASLRTLIAPVVYRLNRCASEDIDVLTHFFTALNTYLASPDEESVLESTLLYYLIVFSEMWETPEPSAAEMLARFTNASISNGGTYTEIPDYCAYSKESSPVCDELDVGNYSANGIIYARDEYWNKSAVIPTQASVLLMNGKLDPQTPYKYATALLGALDGDKKELITFDYATHGTLWTTPLDPNADYSETCGMKLLLSYVSNDGDLASLDKSCVGEMPAFNLTVPLGYQHYFLSSADAYDGEYDASLSADASAGGSASSDSNSSSKYEAVFLVFLVLFVVALALGGFFAYRWYRLKQQKPSGRSTDDLPDHIEISTPIAARS
jgi:pimeloyl-ACP methyl ester carboxylesterase